jgi:hypothetical protein
VRYLGRVFLGLGVVLSSASPLGFRLSRVLRDVVTLKLEKRGSHAVIALNQWGAMRQQDAAKVIPLKRRKRR